MIWDNYEIILAARKLSTYLIKTCLYLLIHFQFGRKPFSVVRPTVHGFGEFISKFNVYSSGLLAQFIQLLTEVPSLYDGIDWPQGL